jgi:hypothetical protein
MHHDDLLVGAGAVATDPHLLTEEVLGTEYWPCSKLTIGVFEPTRRASPNTTVCGSSGTRCSRSRSSASISTGTRRVTRCTRWFTSAMNCSHACSSSGNDPYWSRRFVSVGTRSALATFTDASTPPFEAGSAGWQVNTATP